LSNHATVDVGKEIVKDSPIYGSAVLTIFGYPVENWILWMALAYGAARLGLLGLEYYWKIKDRYDRKR